MLNTNKNNNAISGSKFALYNKDKKIAEAVSDENDIVLFRGLRFNDTNNWKLILRQVSINKEYKINNKDIILDLDKTKDDVVEIPIVNYNEDNKFLPSTGTLSIVPYIVSSLAAISTGIFISKKKNKYN